MLYNGAKFVGCGFESGLGDTRPRYGSWSEGGNMSEGRMILDKQDIARTVARVAV